MLLLHGEGIFFEWLLKALVVAALAALLARGRLGHGQHVDVAMADGVVTLLASPLANYFASGQVPPRGRDRLTGGAPYYNVYETADGQFVTVGAIEPYFWAELCRALGCEDLIARQDAPEPERSQMRERLRGIFRRQTRAEWEERLGELDVCFAPVRSLAEVRMDPQLVQREMVVDVPGSDGTTVPQVGLPIKLSDTPGAIRHGSPLLGQDTDGVLAELGYPAEQIAAWRAEGAVG
jgi:crotonobetainyl-CoA:carnitine CoA-transferase CaiB-like acyl-CoA transferase